MGKTSLRQKLQVRWPAKRSRNKAVKPLLDDLAPDATKAATVLGKENQITVPEVIIALEESQTKDNVLELNETTDSVALAGTSTEKHVTLAESFATTGLSTIQELNEESNFFERKPSKKRDILYNEIEDMPFQSISIPREKPLGVKKVIRRKNKVRPDNFKERAILILKQHSLNISTD